MTTSTPDDNQLFSTTVSTILSPWKIGLVCGLSKYFIDKLKM
jgi:hypothetical protein